MTDVDPKAVRELSRALQRHARVPIELTVSVPTILEVIAVMQLGLAHPEVTTERFPHTARVREMISTISLQLVRLDPAFGDVVKAGWR